MMTSTEIRNHLNNKLESLGDPHLIEVDSGCKFIKDLVEEELKSLKVDFTFVPEHSYTDLKTYLTERPVIYSVFGEGNIYQNKQRVYKMVLHYNLKDYELEPLFIYMTVCKINNKLVYNYFVVRSHCLELSSYDPEYLKNYNLDYEFVRSNNYLSN